MKRTYTGMIWSMSSTRKSASFAPSSSKGILGLVELWDAERNSPGSLGDARKVASILNEKLGKRLEVRYARNFMRDGSFWLDFVAIDAADGSAVWCRSRFR